MDPKHSSNSTIRLPAKKVKIGAVLSGISHAVPGVVHIGSMVPSMNLLGASIFMQEDPIKDSKSNSFQPPPVCLNVVSIAGPAPATTSTSTINPSLKTVNLDTFCHFCLDSCSPPHQYKCMECGTIICEQFITRSSGCIFNNTMEATKRTFLCPVCSRTIVA